MADPTLTWLPALQTAIDALARRHPRSLKRGVRPAVAAAAAAVAARARPGAMLDGCPGLPVDAAIELAACVSSVTGADVVAAHLDGCCYLLSRAALGTPPAAPAAGTAAGAAAGCAPWPIVFGENDGTPAWGSPADAAALAAALAGAAAAVAAAPPGTAVDLAAVSVPPPPLNAWLLGYPVAYNVRDQRGAAAAARALSGGGIVLTKMAAVLGGNSTPIAAFSVPAVLINVQPPVDLGDGWWDAWLASVRAASAVAVSAARTAEAGAFTL